MPLNPLLAPGSNFGLGRIQPTREQGLSLLQGMLGMSPVGDIQSIMQAQSPLDVGLGLLSLGIPGTIRFRGFDFLNKPNSLEKRLMDENKGDARIPAIIRDLQEKEAAGLISEGERFQQLNMLTKSDKQLRKQLQESGQRIGGVSRK